MANTNRRDTPSTSASVVYTEDGVLVRTLYLQRIPQNVSQENIKNYFSEFGEVTSVKIIPKTRYKGKQPAPSRNQYAYRYGFITFAKAEAAAKALIPRNHEISGKYLKAQVADTWQQPNTQQSTVNGNLKHNKGDNKQRSPTILDLNDDCLLHLFTYLTPIEKLKISLVCLRFRYISESLMKEDDVFDFNKMETFTLMEKRQILYLFGSVIKRIHLEGLSKTSKRHLDFIRRYCHNLEELDFDSVQNTHYQNYWRLFSSLKQIKVLKLKDCDINNEICLLISGHTGLKILDLSHNCDVTGEHLHKLTHLDELNLAYCENLQPRDFIDICEANKLKKLNIAGCYLLTEEAFNILVRTQKELEQIIISNSYQAGRIEIVGNLTNLKHIQIHREGVSYFGTGILKEIVENRREQLESLEIYNLSVTMQPENRERILQFRNLKKLCLFRDKYLDDEYLIMIANNCTQLVDLNIGGTASVTADAVVTVVSKLKQLEYLNITFCNQFSDTLCNQIFKVRLEKSVVPLTLYAYGTNISQNFLKTKKYKQYKKLLTLDFTTNDYYFRIIDSLSDDDFNDVFEYFNEDSDDLDIEDFDDFSYDESAPFHLLW